MLKDKTFIQSDGLDMYLSFKAFQWNCPLLKNNEKKIQEKIRHNTRIYKQCILNSEHNESNWPVAYVSHTM